MAFPSLASGTWDCELCTWKPSFAQTGLSGTIFVADRSVRINDVATKTQEGRAEGTAGGLPARERLLAAAEELFYEQGVHSVGINRVLARAGVAKDTLYSAFGSKEALIRAYLARRRESTVARLSAAAAGQEDPRQKILAVFDSQAAVFREPGFRGCAFVAATSEAPPGGVIETDAAKYRTWRRNLFTGLARQAGAADPRPPRRPGFTSVSSIDDQQIPRGRR